MNRNLNTAISYHLNAHTDLILMECEGVVGISFEPVIDTTYQISTFQTEEGEVSLVNPVNSQAIKISTIKPFTHPNGEPGFQSFQNTIYLHDVNISMVKLTNLGIKEEGCKIIATAIADLKRTNINLIIRDRIIHTLKPREFIDYDF